MGHFDLIREMRETNKNSKDSGQRTASPRSSSSGEHSLCRLDFVPAGNSFFGCCVTECVGHGSGLPLLLTALSRYSRHCVYLIGHSDNLP